MDEIKISNLTKRYKDITAVDDLSLNIKKGELLALLGVNGAGKTTTIRILTCLLKPTSGEIRIDNYDIKKDQNKIKEIINISPQETAVAPNLTVMENLEFIAGIYGIKNKNKIINKLIDDFNLQSVLKKKTKTLSGGFQRRLSIAMALINDPKILFLDEPTLGLDVIARHELWNIINVLKGQKTIILTTHYMEEAEKLADRVAIMEKGKLLELGKAEDLVNKYHTKTFEDAFIAIIEKGKQK